MTVTEVIFVQIKKKFFFLLGGGGGGGERERVNLFLLNFTVTCTSGFSSQPPLPFSLYLAATAS